MYVLENLWRDYFSPNVKQAKQESEYHDLAQCLTERRAQILADLSEDGQATLACFERTKDSLAEISEEDTFIEGFRMGAKVMLDVLGVYCSQFE